MTPVDPLGQIGVPGFALVTVQEDRGGTTGSESIGIVAQARSSTATIPSTPDELMATPYCTDCQRNMEGGFLLDNKDSTQEAGAWVEGRPEKSFWGGMKIKGRRKLTMYAWRCPGCSVVRLYAPEG